MPSGRVLAVTNQKGGVGKTTTAVNLAASLAVLERRVLLIDLDPQGAVMLCFGLKPSDVTAGMFDVIAHGESIQRCIHRVGRVELGVVPVNIGSDEDEEAYLLAIRPEILTRALDLVKPVYDYIILDTPPSIGPVVGAAMVAADALVIPVQCEELALRTVGKLLALARKVQRHQNPRLALEGIVLTMADSRTSLTTRVMNVMRLNFGSLLFRTVVPRTVDLARVPVEGEPLLFTRLSARGAQAYLDLASEVIARERRRASA